MRKYKFIGEVTKVFHHLGHMNPGDVQGTEHEEPLEHPELEEVDPDTPVTPREEPQAATEGEIREQMGLPSTPVKNENQEDEDA